ncbi:glycoside hydrolase superfamily [Triangularia setosa]|uniref:Glycoside hydrolase superfamily n=1 Tax=Triangularia setosa TaxID=2587417 RepID=A0AAN7A6S7_9PEZI|nr:glycoside hydrolase superfamily [Podospora setosa]
MGPALLLHLTTGLTLLTTTTLIDLTNTIDTTSNREIWKGWDTSLAWWAAAFGQRDDLVNIFFTLRTAPHQSQPLPGLGLAIARYNAGASSSNIINPSNTRMIVSPSTIPSRLISGFWLRWTYSSPSPPSWNWSTDPNQRAMLSKATARGANILELFSNSSMWWTCKNHNPSGSDGGKSDNVQSWNHRNHAVYLATIAKYASENWGSEPSATWWNGKIGTQEGCHFDASTQADVVGYLRSKLNSRGLQQTIISASDESHYDEAVATLNKFSGNATVMGVIARAGKKLWQSEYGEADATGKRLVSNLLLDMRWLRPTAWVYWQVLDGGGWELIEADNNRKTIGQVNQKYFVLAQFARHIRPGMRILDAGSDYAIAAYDHQVRKLVIVVVNWGDVQYINFDLSRFGAVGTNGSTIKRWVTQIGSGSRCVEHSDTQLSGTKLWSRFEKKMVQTFEVSGVVL